MRNIVIRTLSGIVFTFSIIYCLVAGSRLSGALFGLFATISLYEYLKLSRRGQGNVLLEIVALISGIVLYFIMWMNASFEGEIDLFLYILPLALLSLVVVLFGKQQTWFQQISSSWFGLLYVIGPFALITHLSFIEGGYNYVIPLGIFITVWIADTAAFLAGTFFGKHKMIERISPGKTWEGTAGALVFSLITAYTLEYFFGPLSSGNWYVLCFIIAISGVLGDLFESKLKRAAGVKDSGKIMPGHGGALDRFDAILFAIPVSWLYLTLA
jgi:phosphatidate cytidylyltransferase